MALVYLSSKREAAIKQNIPWANIDAGIRGMVRRFNKIKGIATTQSCQGHVKVNKKRGFGIDPATIAIYVNRKRLMQLLSLAPEYGIRELNIRYFNDGTFWVCFGCDPANYKPMYKMARTLLGKKQAN